MSSFLFFYYYYRYHLFIRVTSLNTCFMSFSQILCCVRVHIYLLWIMTSRPCSFCGEKKKALLLLFFFPPVSGSSRNPRKSCARSRCEYYWWEILIRDLSESVTFPNACGNLLLLFFFFTKIIIRKVLKRTHSGFRASSCTTSIHSFFINVAVVVVLLCVRLPNFIFILKQTNK